jgi:hypothetical protein
VLLLFEATTTAAEPSPLRDALSTAASPSPGGRGDAARAV